MRIATLILTLVLGAFVTLQGCALYVGGALSEEEKFSMSGAVGIGMALCWLVAAAFVLGKPTVSLVFYLIGAVMALSGIGLGYTDMWIWLVVSLVFAVFSWLGRRELRAKKAATVVAA